MNILAVSYAYSPQIGGVETMTRVMVDEWLRIGHDVQVVTHAEGEVEGQPCPVHRRPSSRTLTSLHDWAHVVWHNNISLSYAWPAIKLRKQKPWFVSHATVLEKSTALPVRVAKKFVFKLTHNIAVSKYVHRAMGANTVVVPNPYDDNRFRVMPDVVRDEEVVFLGRLVSDKGADLAVQACQAARQSGHPFQLTIIGKGPEEGPLREAIAQFGLQDIVRLAGALTGEDLVWELNRHKVMIVPSRWPEPFGIVALEGAACGLVVVGPTHGGLPEAVGPCGPLLDIQDVKGWSRTIQSLLATEEARTPYLQAAPPHLQRHTASHVAGEYLRLFEAALGRPS